MSTIIIYSTKHGTTEKVAEVLAEQLDADTFRLEYEREVPPGKINNYDTIIIGGSIHAGNIQKEIKEFCEKNEDALLKKKLGLFMCCMQRDKEQQEFDNAFPKTLREHSKANGLFGGEFIFEKMNFIEKFLVKKIAKTNKTVSELNYEAIEKFINKFNS